MIARRSRPQLGLVSVASDRSILHAGRNARQLRSLGNART
jgi:hypothetical protein